MLRFPASKDPSDIADYSFDWSRALGDGDTIASSGWAVTPAGPTLASGSFTATTSKIWVSGGTAGTVYTLTNLITTAGGRTLERSAQLTVRNL